MFHCLAIGSVATTKAPFSYQSLSNFVLTNSLYFIHKGWRRLESVKVGLKTCRCWGKVVPATPWRHI